jgi:hypothetical protein
MILKVNGTGKMGASYIYILCPMAILEIYWSYCKSNNKKFIFFLSYREECGRCPEYGERER